MVVSAATLLAIGADPLELQIMTRDPESRIPRDAVLELRERTRLDYHGPVTARAPQFVVMRRVGERVRTHAIGRRGLQEDSMCGEGGERPIRRGQTHFIAQSLCDVLSGQRRLGRLEYLQYGAACMRHAETMCSEFVHVHLVYTTLLLRIILNKYILKIHESYLEVEPCPFVRR